MRVTKHHLINDNPLCTGCKYNTHKTQGGYGKECNGGTMDDHNRCPEWKINEDKEREKVLARFGPPAKGRWE